MSTNEGISCEASLLEGLTLDCSYSGDVRFVAEFRRSKVSYWIVDQRGQISNRNMRIPYQCRQLRIGLIEAACHETSVGDFLAMIVDFEDMSIHVSGVVGYPDDSQSLVFQTGRITSVQTEVARLRDPQVERVGELRL